MAWVLVLACGVTVAAAQQKVSPVKYVAYRNTQFKVATEVPGHWQSEGKNSPTSSSLVFSGPKGTDEYYTTINFQVVQRRAQGEDGIELRARDLQRQWETAAKYELISQEEGQLSDAPAGCAWSLSTRAPGALTCTNRTSSCPSGASTSI